MQLFPSLEILIALSSLCGVSGYPGEEQHEIGTLSGDVQNWAVLIQNYIIQVGHQHTYLALGLQKIIVCLM